MKFIDGRQIPCFQILKILSRGPQFFCDFVGKVPSTAVMRLYLVGHWMATFMIVCEPGICQEFSEVAAANKQCVQSAYMSGLLICRNWAVVAEFDADYTFGRGNDVTLDFDLGPPATPTRVTPGSSFLQTSNRMAGQPKAQTNILITRLVPFFLFSLFGLTGNPLDRNYCGSLGPRLIGVAGAFGHAIPAVLS